MRGRSTQWSSVVVVVRRDIPVTEVVLVSMGMFGIRVARFGGGNLRSGVFIGNMRTVAHSVAAMTTMAVPIVLVIVVAVVGLVPAIGIGGLYRKQRQYIDDQSTCNFVMVSTVYSAIRHRKQTVARFPRTTNRIFACNEYRD